MVAKRKRCFEESAWPSTTITFTIRCVGFERSASPQNIAGEAVTILYSTYQPDIKSVKVLLCYELANIVAHPRVVFEQGKEANA